MSEAMDIADIGLSKARNERCSPPGKDPVTAPQDQLGQPVSNRP